MGLDTHQRTKLHNQQVGSDLGALGQTLHQSRVLQGAGEERNMRSAQRALDRVTKRPLLHQHVIVFDDKMFWVFQGLLTFVIKQSCTKLLTLF